MLALSETLLDELTAVARANDTGAQELLRRAARAIVRCHHELGTVPMDMQIIQRPIGSILGNASEEQLGQIIQERLKSSKWETNEAGELAADLAAEITRRAHPTEYPKRKTK